MSTNLLAQQRLKEIESNLVKTSDTIERLYLWVSFIKNFSRETQKSYDEHYNEFAQLCENYVLTPDPGVRSTLRRQIKTVALELQHFNEIMMRVAQIQKRLETDLTSR